MECLEDRTVPSVTLGMGLSGMSTALAGSYVTYTIVLSNAGPDAAQNFSLTDVLPSGVTFVSQTQNGGPAFTLGNSGGQVTDTIAALPSGSSASFTVVGSIPASTPNNTALVDQANLATTSQVTSSSTTSASVTTTVQNSGQNGNQATLNLTAGGPTLALTGSQITYTLTLSNSGSVAAQGIDLIDALPSGTTFVSQSQTSGPAFMLGNYGYQITDTTATLPAGTSASFSIVALIPASTPDNTTLVDNANVSVITQLSSSSVTSASVTTTATNVDVWTGAAGDSQWGTAGNWNTGSVPGSSNDVVIPEGAPQAVAGGTVTVHNLELDGALEVDGTFGANDVTLGGGALTGDGVLSVGAGLTWTGGEMSGTGTTFIGSGAGLTISGSSPLSLDGWTMDNAGTATWGGGDITAGGAARVINEASATFALDGSPNFVDSTGTSTFVNNGVFTKSSDGGESDIGASFQNGSTGTVAVDGGMLGFGNGGSSSGTFQIAGGAAAALKGGAFGLGGLVLGTGQLVIGSGFTDTTATVNTGGGTMNVQNMVLVSGGTLTGGGEVDVANGFQWGGGTIKAFVNVVVVQGASLSITGVNSKTLDEATLINKGTATWNGGSLVLSGDAAFHNAGSITANGSLALGTPDGAFGTFSNDGGQFIQTSGTLVVNAAQVEASAGSSFTIQGSGAINFQSSVGGTLAGSFTAPAGTQVSFGEGGGVWNLTPTTTFGGAGTYFLQTGASLVVGASASLRVQNFVMSGGVLDGSGDFGAASFSWTGGTMQGTGRTYELSGDVMTISGGAAGDQGDFHTLRTRTLLNQGTIIWQNDAGDVLLAGTVDGDANIVNDGSAGEGVFEAWADSTILPDNPATTTSSFTVRDGGQFIKPSDEYNGYRWTSINVNFENDSGTVELDGALATTWYDQPFGLTQVGGMGIFTITTSNDPASPKGITGGNVEVSGVLSFAATSTLWGGTCLLTGGAIETNGGSPTPGGTGTTGGFYLGPNATLSGSGTIYAQLINSGTIAPGNGASFGNILVEGSFSVYSRGASLLLKFGGQAGNDSFQVQQDQSQGVGSPLGDVGDLGGTLQVTLVDGYSPPSESEFSVFSWAAGRTDPSQFDNSVLVGPDGTIAHQTQYNANSVGFIVP